ncbi:hypothetical protein V1477_008856 [Vespula maculifrons]|uniref:Uncharacterized protein n=1 Tax=Vespula maculifrons TaxID=7453 RepID=A0ABD2CE78_VESMC
MVTPWSEISYPMIIFKEEERCSNFGAQTFEQTSKQVKLSTLLQLSGNRLFRVGCIFNPSIEMWFTTLTSNSQSVDDLHTDTSANRQYKDRSITMSL